MSIQKKKLACLSSIIHFAQNMAPFLVEALLPVILFTLLLGGLL